MRSSVGCIRLYQPGPPDESRCVMWRSSNHHRTMYPIPTNNSMNPSQLAELLWIIEYTANDNPNALRRMPLRRSDQTTRRRVATASCYTLLADEHAPTPTA